MYLYHIKFKLGNNSSYLLCDRDNILSHELPHGGTYLGRINVGNKYFNNHKTEEPSSSVGVAIRLRA
jgi:hypothetical protein